MASSDSAGIRARASVSWRKRIQSGLAAIAAELPFGNAACPEQLFDDVVRLHLILVGCFLPPPKGTCQFPPTLSADANLNAWVESCLPGNCARWPALQRWLESESLDWTAQGQPPLPRLGNVELSNRCLTVVLNAIGGFLSAAPSSPGDLVGHLGDLHQLLLSVQFTRAEASGRVPSMAPISPKSRSEGSRWVAQPGGARRRAGAHYTPAPLCKTLVEQTLQPLLEQLPNPLSENILQLKICDPAMGAGVFLVGTCIYLGEKLENAWDEEQRPFSSDENRKLAARRSIVEHVLYGVDLDAHAVGLTRLALAHLCDSSPSKLRGLTEHFKCGNSTIGEPLTDSLESPRGFDLNEVFSTANPVHWPRCFPEVFARTRSGFDAVLGNPPWVSYVGRATQPIPPKIAAYHKHYSHGFRRYRTLHGLFVERCARLLRQRGRLGLLLPTSVADLEGYQPTRLAHNRLCQVDPLLPDWSERAFEGVFQPTMALLASRREIQVELKTPLVDQWPLKGATSSTVERQLLERLSALPRCPSELFGERGYQTHPADRQQLKKQSEPAGRFRLPFQQGADLTEFQVFPPQVYADPSQLAGRVRSAEQWQQVAVWIRQTSRFPIAAIANGNSFRNSILAAFQLPHYPSALLVTYLNSTLVRWYHFHRHRDARQGMPQLKIGHLRTLPEFPASALQRNSLIKLGKEWSQRNCGLSSEERRSLDQLVCDAFNISASERDVLEQWRNQVPTPRSRRLPSTRES